MALDLYKNGSRSTLLSGISDTDNTLTVDVGTGSKFPTAPFNCIVWNNTDFPDPLNDPNYEIVRVTNVTGDVLTITRAQESTTAATHNIIGKTYGVAATLTAKLFNTDLPNTFEPTLTAGLSSQYYRGDKTWQALTNGAVGLGNVQNIALSSWGGSTSLTTLGTISAGTWQGTPIGDTYVASASTWNAKANAFTTGNSLTLSASVLDTIQDIRTTANPSFSTVNVTDYFKTLKPIANGVRVDGLVLENSNISGDGTSSYCSPFISQIGSGTVTYDDVDYPRPVKFRSGVVPSVGSSQNGGSWVLQWWDDYYNQWFNRLTIGENGQVVMTDLSATSIQGVQNLSVTNSIGAGTNISALGFNSNSGNILALSYDATGAHGTTTPGNGLRLSNSSGTASPTPNPSPSIVFASQYYDGEYTSEFATSINTYAGELMIGNGYGVDTSTALFRLNSAGRLAIVSNVGIGTSVPNKASKTRALTLNGSSDAILEFCIGETLGGYVYKDASHLEIDAGTGFMQLNAGNIERLRILANGNIGLASTPLGRLHIGDTVVGGRSDSLLLHNEGTTSGSGTAIYMGYQSAGVGLYGARILQIGHPASTRTSSLALQVHNTEGSNNDTAWIDGVYIKSDGTVGIGTSNPSEKLEVAGNMRTTGLGINTPPIAANSLTAIVDGGTATASRFAFRCVQVGTQSASWGFTGASTIASGGGTTSIGAEGGTDRANATRLRIVSEPNVGFATIISDATGTETAKTLRIIAPQINMEISGVGSVGNYTSTGLNSVAIGATTPSTGAFTNLNLFGKTNNKTIGGTGAGQWYDGNTTTERSFLGMAQGSDNLFRLYSNIIPGDIMAWNLSSGNVGIGTTGPVTKLVVSDNATFGIEFNPNASGTGLMEWYNRNTSAYFSARFIATMFSFDVGPLKLGNISTPGDTPSSSGYLYVEGGALKFKGSSGTVTTIAPA